jgi:phosphate:Na+ symporter
MAGFGMLFLGLDIISDSVEFFKIFQEFRNIFLVKNKLVLFLNGIIITAIIQSSSAVTSVMIILAGFEILTFENSMFLILGSNVGSCFSVIIATLSKNEEARRAGIFNLIFNLLGSIIFLIPLSLYSQQISNFFISFSHSEERAIANFHTIFNVLVTILILPVLTPLVNLISLTIKDKPLKLQKATQYV